MDKDRVKGTMDDAAGRAKRQVGERTGDTGTQAEGATQQVKGKGAKAWGNGKGAPRGAPNRSGRDGVVGRGTVAARARGAGDLGPPRGWAWGAARQAVPCALVPSRPI